MASVGAVFQDRVFGMRERLPAVALIPAASAAEETHRLMRIPQLLTARYDKWKKARPKVNCRGQGFRRSKSKGASRP